MASGSRSAPSVTPVVLREELRPPQYGDEYSESASRSFYIRYEEYKKRVEHANSGGAVRHQVVSISQLVPTHVQQVFARVEKRARTITAAQLVEAIKRHAGHEEGAEVELIAAKAAVAKAVAMKTRGKTLLERVEPILSNLEKFFNANPNIALVCRSSDGWNPGSA